MPRLIRAKFALTLYVSEEEFAPVEGRLRAARRRLHRLAGDGLVADASHIADAAGLLDDFAQLAARIRAAQQGREGQS